jgi:hypothetical protein
LTPEQITAAATVALAVLTLVLAIGSVFLWLSTRQLVLGAKKTAEQQLRPYVFVKSASFEELVHYQDIWRIRVVIQNFGLTPAYQVVLKVESEISGPKDASLIIPLSNNALAHPKTSLPPGHQITAGLICAELGVGNMAWRTARVEGRMAYLWGRVDYADAFNHRRFTTFQMVCDFDRVLNFAFCACGNEVDSD